MGAGQSPYMNVLRSYDKIPRVHNILVSFFVWILLAGFVIVPGSFTSLKRRVQDGGTLPPEVGRTGGEIEKFLLTRDNTIAMVIGFVCIGVGAFGSAWLALRWRRDYVGLFNYVWLLNKLYMPLILASSAGLIANFTAIYTQQVGEWSTPAVISAIVEASILGVSLLLYFAYNYWLQQRVRAEKEGTFTGWMEKKSRMNKKKKRGARLNGLLARLGRVRKKSVVSVV
ncbi:hypothetical protein N656DRAFT_707292 [Canariomyces notabilis]|uniref:Uncharacterized protein n=1 Tax=Canariomyces notabilis TaxID=2074819 RepID=A0AAN6TGB3_9PEZI|nr:hypothetical protein N656DRAFT_707292 [Canariomyces arenarius]